MIKALSLAFQQSFDPAFRRVFWRSLLASTATFILVWLFCWLSLSWAGDLLSDWLADTELWDWLKSLLSWLFGAGALAGIIVASFFLFPAVMLLVMSLLLEEIALAVEKRHYPNLPPARRQKMPEVVFDAVVFAAMTLLANLAALPFYLFFLFLPPLIPFVFYTLNGYLLGREYFEMVAVRRLDSPTGKKLRKSHRGRVILAGVIIAFLLTVPLVNLITPIVATAFMLHVFEELRRRRGLGP